jgi:hypothetical protein
MFRSKRRRAALIVTALMTVSAGASFAVANVRDSEPGRLPLPVLLAPATGQVPLLPGAPDDVLSTLASRFPLVSNVRVGITKMPQEENPAESTDVRTVTYDLAVDSVVGSDATIPAGMAETVAERADQIGLRDVSVTTVRALQGAIEIVATASDPATAIAAYKGSGGLAGLLGIDPAIFEGVLLRIDDRTGTAVLFQGQAARNGSWLHWTDPAFATDE